MTQQLKTPPNSKESEMMVLGCMLTTTQAFKIAADSLNDSDFPIPTIEEIEVELESNL